MSYDKEIEQTRPAIEQAAKELREGNLALHGTQFDKYRMAMVLAATILEVMLDDRPKPIDMVLYCPACGTQHIDAPRLAGDPNAPSHPTEGMSHEEAQPLIDALADYEASWTNPPHRSHLCHSCGHIWRPADVPTNGVQTIETRGRADTDLAWMIKAIAAKRARDEQKVASFDQVLDLCGSWQDGSDTTVKISQDDACRCYVLTVGKNTFTAPSLTEALRLAATR